MVVGNGEGGARYSSEQWHGAAVQRLSPSGGCGGPWRSGVTEARRRARQRAQRRRERGRNQGTPEAWRWRAGGRNQGTTKARRRAQRGRATMAESTSFSPAVRWRSKTSNASFVDGGAIGDGGQRRTQSWRRARWRRAKLCLTRERRWTMMGSRDFWT